MENKIKKTLFVIIAVLVVGVLAYQQVMMGKLSKTVVEIAKTNGGKFGGAADSGKNPFMAEAVKNTLTAETKELKGVVISKGVDYLVVEGSVVDLSKLSGLPDSVLEKGDSFPKIKNQFTIGVNADTEMPIRINGIKIGSNVDIFTDNSIYGGAKLTAKKVWLLLAPGAEINSHSGDDFFNTTKYIGGSIKEIGNNYFIVEVQWVNAPENGDTKNFDLYTAPKTVKTYKVFIDNKTVFANNDKNSFKVGDEIDAYSDKPVFSLAEFTATKIEGPFVIFL